MAVSGSPEQCLRDLMRAQMTELRQQNDKALLSLAMNRLCAGAKCP
jgi:hypothetical protein